MGYFVSSLRYLFSKQGVKKLLFFILFATIPSAITAFVLPLPRVLGIIQETESVPFGRLWLTLFPHPYALISLFLSFIISIFSSACISSALTYHMKIGQFGLPKFFTSLNNNFFPCFARTLSLCISLLTSYTLFILMDCLWNYALEPLAAIIASSVTFALFSFLFCYFVSSVSLWLPTMILTGQSWRKALSTAFYQSKKNQKNFFVFYVIIITITVVFSTAAFFIRPPILAWGITTISYTLTFILTHIYFFIAFFDVNQVTRADLTISSYKRRL